MLIGICGKSGSGKTTFAIELKERLENSIHIKVDEIGHNVLLLPKVKEELVNLYGNKIIKDNEINRKELSKIVFDSEKEMDNLTSITWKHMQEELNNIIEKNKDKIIILDWALLPKTDYLNKCKIKILFDISYEERKKRALLRDNIKEEDFALREKASLNYNYNDFDIVFTDNNKNNIERVMNLI